MADILLSVGMQTGSAETSEFINQLQGTINSLNRNNDLKAKIGVQLNESSLNEFQSKIADALSRLSSSGVTSVKLKLDGVGDFEAKLQNVAKSANDVQNVFKQLQALQSQIGNKELQLIKLDPQKNAEQINAIRNELNALKTTYDNLFSSNKSNLSQAQLNQLAQGFENAAAKARELQAAMQDKANNAASADRYRTEAEALREYERSVTDVFKQLQALQSQIGNKELRLAGLDPVKNASEIAVLKDQIRSLKAEYENLLSTNREKLSPEQIRQLGQISDQTAAKIRELNAAMKDKSAGLNALESRFVYMLSLSNVILQAVRQIKQMVKTTIELDSAMTQLRVVTNASEADYSRYGAAVANTAQEIGASMTDLIDSATVFARLGYSLDESSFLAKYTAMLSNVGNIDVSSAQSALTAITKAYGISADEIESVMDKMVVVGNNFPISVAELAEGMNNAGSALAAAGNSFEQSIALLTAANTTVQNISKSSTGLRTITARIRGTRLELDELGEAIETAKYQEAIDILTKHKVALTDNGEFRATYDILKDIAAVWNELSSMEQANIAEQLAGKILLLLPVRTEMCA